MPCSVLRYPQYVPLEKKSHLSEFPDPHRKMALEIRIEKFSRLLATIVIGDAKREVGGLICFIAAGYRNTGFGTQGHWQVVLKYLVIVE